MKIWQQLLATLSEQKGPLVLVTVFDVVGSSPRECGARMIVPSYGPTLGTIGGGLLEWDAINEVRTRLSGPDTPKSWKADKLLGPDLAQCCGGGVTLLYERFTVEDSQQLERLAQAEEAGPFETHCHIEESGAVVREVTPVVAGFDRDAALLESNSTGLFIERFANRGYPIALFGAGHVGKALVNALSPLPFEIDWIESRNDMFPPSLANGLTTHISTKPSELLRQVDSKSLVIVMTHSHAIDFELTLEALKRPSFPYVGLIGSKSKSARFRSRLKKQGVSTQELDRLVCPIGITDICGKQPPVLAASISAQLLQKVSELSRLQSTPG